LGIEYTIDHVRPVANNTEDIALFMNAVAGPDNYDQRYYTYLKYSDFSIDNIDNKERKTLWERESRISYGISNININYHDAWKNYSLC
jgi:Asp-tRNA(Asn)/Glu-tRNA(Gln) amidotransferase A subunit family amidase